MSTLCELFTTQFDTLSMGAADREQYRRRWARHSKGERAAPDRILRCSSRNLVRGLVAVGVIKLMLVAMLVREFLPGDLRHGRSEAGNALGEAVAARLATQPEAPGARTAELFGTTRPETLKQQEEGRANHSLEAQRHRGSRSSRRRSRKRSCRRPLRPAATRPSWRSCSGAMTRVPSR